MERICSGGLVYDCFSSFSQVPWLFHGCFTRKGGVSEGPYEGLNTGLNTGDSAQAVSVNRKAILDESGGGELVVLSQVHGKGVHVHTGTGVDSVEADALVTDRPGAMLTILTADCQAVVLVDPVKRVVANAHAGWRGSVEGVLPETVSVMENRFGCCPSDLLAGIGPSLGPCCAEFVHYKKELPRSFCTHRVGFNHFDFWAISRDQLCNTGLKAKNITAAQVCTQCDDEHYFSYRRSHTTGRMATVIGIK
ncbi:laccase domain protein [Desulfoluna limicola]|uniref:Purine nucleoside phosphorylase n=1 Tax=Desulfoluna limicola TaxID=2810562 RepID=A0ABM7PQ29_9BACT|nr:peptidoglycan editing factor PgeF [Desulfoluna limicola]BCS99341.1 laccase domain protein [Desulfoluna limicola]